MSSLLMIQVQLSLQTSNVVATRAHWCLLGVLGGNLAATCSPRCLCYQTVVPSVFLCTDIACPLMVSRFPDIFETFEKQCFKAIYLAAGVKI